MRIETALTGAPVSAASPFAPATPKSPPAKAAPAWKNNANDWKQCEAMLEVSPGVTERCGNTAPRSQSWCRSCRYNDWIQSGAGGPEPR
jgi:hypothetical protein